MQQVKSPEHNPQGAGAGADNGQNDTNVATAVTSEDTKVTKGEISVEAEVTIVETVEDTKVNITETFEDAKVNVDEKPIGPELSVKRIDRNKESRKVKKFSR